MDEVTYVLLSNAVSHGCCTMEVLVQLWRTSKSVQSFFQQVKIQFNDNRLFHVKTTEEWHILLRCYLNRHCILLAMGWGPVRISLILANMLIMYEYFELCWRFIESVHVHHHDIVFGISRNGKQDVLHRYIAKYGFPRMIWGGTEPLPPLYSTELLINTGWHYFGGSREIEKLFQFIGYSAAVRSELGMLYVVDRLRNGQDMGRVEFLQKLVVPKGRAVGYRATALRECKKWSHPLTAILINEFLVPERTSILGSNEK